MKALTTAIASVTRAVACGDFCSTVWALVTKRDRFEPWKINQTR
ncbi:hypothetical protein [Nostoc sp. NMS4]|nr:hypothetical protein [Nostoc sp. NMS4]